MTWGLIATVLLSLIGSLSPHSLQADTAGRFVFGGVRHDYFLALLEPAAGPTALVVALHGYDDTVAQFRDSTQLETGADLAGMAVLSSQASPDTVGKAALNVGEGTADQDDLGNLMFAIEDITATYDIDPKRVFLVGYSNGASMAYQLACSRADAFAAIVAVAGNISARDWQTCDPEHRVPVLHIHGRDDDVVAMTGDPVTEVPSLPALLDRWADWNGAVRNESANSYSNGHLTRFFDSVAPWSPPNG